jgi:hypothetical protein
MAQNIRDFCCIRNNSDVWRKALMKRRLTVHQRIFGVVSAMSNDVGELQ